MRRIPIMLLLVLSGAGASLANQAAAGWCETGAQVMIVAGISSTTQVQASYPSCTVTVLIHGGGTATIFSDNSNTPLANPFTAQTNGRWLFYAANGRYDIQMSGGGLASTVTYSDVVLNDPAAQTFLPNTALSFSATPNFPVSSNVSYTMTLTGNVTSSTTTGTPVNGNLLSMTLIQDATGGRTFSFPVNFTLPSGFSFNTAPSATNALLWRFDGTNWNLLSYSLGGGTSSAAWTFNGAVTISASGSLTVSGAITCTNINTIRCISPTNPQGWSGTDLGAWINSAFTNCGSSACEVDVADGTYSVSTQVAPTTANLYLKFGAVTITWNAALNLSAANGFHLRGIGGGFLQSSGYPDVGAKATKFINGMSNSDLIFATPGTNVVLGGIIIEDVALIGNGSSATSGSNIHFNAIQGASNIASVRDFSIQRVYSINAKGNGLQMTGAVFCPGNSCIRDSQINFNQGSNILVEPGASTVFASQIRLTNVDTEGSVTGWGREYEPSFTDVYDNNGTVQGNFLGGALCNGGQCRFLNYHSEGQGVVDIKFLNTAVGGSVMSSSLGGNSSSPTGKGIWITGNSAGLVIENNTYSGHAASSDIVMDANVSFVHILDPPTNYSLTVYWQPFNLYFPNGLTKFGFMRFSLSLSNGANQNIAAGTANFIRIIGPSSAFSLGGFTGGADGKILRVMNDTTQVMTINNQDGGSTAANRILTGTGGNVVLAAGNQICDFSYEMLNLLWRLAGCNIGDQPVGATMTQTLTNKILTSPVINGTNSGSVSNTGINNNPGNTAALTADWTCGTGGTVSSCVAATIIGSGGGVPLTFTLPLAAQSYTLECDGVVGQATAATANQWNLLTATNGATNVTANYSMATAATASAYGAVTDQTSTTTTFQIAPSWTLGGTATKMPFHIWAKIEGASASGTVVSLQLVAPTVGDLVTIFRGAACRIF